MGRLSLHTQGAYTEVWGTTRGCKRSRASARNPDRAHTRVHTFTFANGITCCRRLSTCRPQAKSLNRHRAHSRPNRLFDYTTFLFLFFLFYACSWLSQDEPTKIRLPLRCQTLSREDVSINLLKETRTRRFCSNFEFWNCFNTASDTFLFQLSSYTFFKNYLIN